MAVKRTKVAILRKPELDAVEAGRMVDVLSLRDEAVTSMCVRRNDIGEAIDRLTKLRANEEEDGPWGNKEMCRGLDIAISYLCAQKDMIGEMLAQF